MTDGPQNDSIEFLLLDLHVARLGAEETERVEDALAKSPELAAKNRVLREVLAALDADEVAEPPADLTESVLARIVEQTAALPFKEPAPAIPSAAAHDLSASPVLSLRELVAIAACITMFVGIFVPGYFKARAITRRNLCRQNMAQVMRGMDAYAEENDGYIAHCGFEPGASWLQTRTPNVRRFSNTRPLFTLLREGFVRNARVFICPATPNARPMLVSDPTEFTDFAEPANVSYSFQYMNEPEGRRLEDMHAGMALLADANPLFDARFRGHVLDPYDEGTANSLAHEEGAGQNVAYADGRGGWYTRPTVGVNEDNIYRAGRLLRYQGTESPTSPTDNLLVP